MKLDEESSMNKLVNLVVLFIFVSCSNQTKQAENETQVKRYLHISHTRTKINPKLDSFVEQLNFEKYDMLWLGGDLAQLTSEEESTMQHVDSIFNLSSRNTLWSLGNHDYTDLVRVQKFTKRSPYYTCHQNGMTIVVLDTQDSLSNTIGKQKDFLFGVLDTLKESSHLVLLHHKLIWMHNHVELEKRVPSVSNAGLGDCFYCINPNNFNSEVYPKLVELKQSGVEVICIGGDIGFKIKEFEYLTAEGIQFLASGIHAGERGNKTLLFIHDVQHQNLSWKFVKLEDV
ncbi:MAG: hypothetical protein ACJAV5_000689 [Vicingaceae bacterium]|jgi:hypothetical protein